MNHVSNKSGNKLGWFFLYPHLIGLFVGYNCQLMDSPICLSIDVVEVTSPKTMCNGVVERGVEFCFNTAKHSNGELKLSWQKEKLKEFNCVETCSRGTRGARFLVENRRVHHTRRQNA
ncbi:hypothetical protein QL285_023566 [Trifolium repens]|nr:hypothetical protein QL285_023566 [Trifolium repens]